MNILITGITGFFGSNFVDYIITHKIACTLVGTAHSESKLSYFKKYFPQVKTYILDFSSSNLYNEFDSIVRTHNINYIIHTAAMKHVDLCQENPTLTLKINVIASEILIQVGKKNNVINIIGMSTDKSNDPCNTYGISKSLMQELFLSNGYSVYQGVNFFWSTGSVLDIWFNQYIRNKPLSLRDSNHVRYFNTIDHVCDKIYKNLNAKKQIILPDYAYVIKLKDLLDAFCEYFSYNNIFVIEKYEFEKQIEIIKEGSTQRINLSQSELVNLIGNFYKNMR